MLAFDGLDIAEVGKGISESSAVGDTVPSFKWPLISDSVGTTGRREMLLGLKVGLTNGFFASDCNLEISSSDLEVLPLLEGLVSDLRPSSSLLGLVAGVRSLLDKCPDTILPSFIIEKSESKSFEEEERFSVLLSRLSGIAHSCKSSREGLTDFPLNSGLDWRLSAIMLLLLVEALPILASFDCSSNEPSEASGLLPGGW